MDACKKINAFYLHFLLICSKFELLTSQGRQQHILGMMEDITLFFVANFISFLAVKKFETLLRFHKVIADNMRDVFETQRKYLCQR